MDNDIYFTDPTNDEVKGYTETEESISLETDVSGVFKKSFASTATSSVELYKSISKFETSLGIGRDWNENFQSLLEISYKDPEKELERVRELRKLCSDFAQTAAQVGKVIVSELFVEEKSILPITAQVGGVAGGAKYFHEGIFFKIPVDNFGIYDGEEGIIKSAGHEFQGVLKILDCRIKGLHVPLMVLFDYKGWRVLAASLLPLGGSTLVYGSGDGGRTILASSEQMNAKVETLAKLLNLQGEYVWNNARTERVFLHLSCDIEGHIGKDKRFYLVDTARLLPPATPIRGVRGSFLTNLLRPEFVKTYPIPLCADSFSGFGLENRQKHNQEIRDATAHLETVLIPHFAHILPHAFIDQPAVGQLENLVITIHRKGINLRYLGLIRKHVTNPEIRKILLTEMVARAVKNNIRQQMRKLKTAENTAYTSLVVSHFNCIFYLSSTTNTNEGIKNVDNYWTEILNTISKQYRDSLSDEELHSQNLLHSDINYHLLFPRLNALLGVKFSPDVKEGLENFALTSKHILDMIPVVKHIHRVSFEEATVLSKMAISKNSDELFDMAISRYRESIDSMPNDYRSLSNWGLSLYLQACSKRESLSATEQEIDDLFLAAESKFKESISIEPSDSKTLIKWGNCLVQRSKNKLNDECTIILQRACEKYEKAAQLNPIDYEIFYNWGNTLLTLSNVDSGKAEKYLVEACDKYAIASMSKSDSFETLRNWAVALSKRAKNKMNEEADQLFDLTYSKCNSALKLKSTDHETYFNLANTMYHHAQTKETNSSTWNSLLQLSGDNYWQTLKLKPNFYAALNNWTRLLLYWGRGFAQNNVQYSREFINTVDNYLSILKILTMAKAFPMEISPLIQYAKYCNPSTALSELVELFVNNGSIDSVANSYQEDDLHISTEISRSISKKTVYTFLILFAEKVTSWLKSKEDPMKLSENNFKVLKVVGGNGFSTVYKVQQKDTGNIYAMKVLRKEFVISSEQNLHHPFITELKMTFDDSKRIYFIYEFVSGGPIEAYVQIEKKFSEDTCKFYAAEIVLALIYMHSEGIIYQNLILDKVLLDAEGHIKLVQKIVLNNAERGSQLFLPSCEFMAPEILEGRDIGTAADWWTLGVFIFYFLTGTTPFVASTLEKTIESILSENFVIPTDLSPNAQSIIKMLLNTNELERQKDVGNIQVHPFFAGIQWDLLAAKILEPPIKPTTEATISTSDSDMSATVVMPNLPDNFMGFTYVSPNLEAMLTDK